MTSSDTFDFKIRFYTEEFAPNHSLSLRTDVDGWDYEIYGDYTASDPTANDTRSHWLFNLDSAHYQGVASGTIRIRFVLDGQEPMQQADIEIAPSGDHAYDDTAISFENLPERFVHGFANLQTFDSPVEQKRFRPNHSGNITYDVVVIGSGMSGGILADELSDRGAKVLLLEAGSLLFPTHMYNLPGDWAPLKDKYFVHQHVLAEHSTFSGGVKINFGGGSLFWSGIIQQAKEWEFGGHWPTPVVKYLLEQNGREETGYQRALTLMREQVTRGEYENKLKRRLAGSMADYEVESLPRARHQPHLVRLPDGHIGLQNVIRESNGMFSTVDLLLDSMSYPGPVGDANLTINLNHMVTRIETDGRVASRVVCQDLKANQSRTYTGRIVVLAAGSLGSARIALKSDLDDDSNLIGIGLTDHPHFSIRCNWGLDGAPIGIDDHAKLMIRHHEAADRHHPYNIEVMVNYQYWDRRVTDEDIWGRIVQPKDAVGSDVQFFFPSALHDDNYARFEPADAKKMTIYSEPNSGGREYADEITEIAHGIFRDIGQGVEPQYRGEMLYFDGAQIGHLGGTLRMGRRGESVVDESQRLHNFDNIYVADLSVFPSILAAKPSLTLAALTLRLADTIMGQLPQPAGNPAFRGIRTHAQLLKADSTHI